MWLLPNYCPKGEKTLISPIQPWVAKRTGLGKDLSAKNLEEWQLKKVQNIIEYARSKSVFYQKHLQRINGADIHSYQDMQNIPFTYPEDVISDSKAFVCVNQNDISRITSLFTSGSQESPKRIYFTENDLERTVDFFAHGMNTIVQSGQSTLVLMSDKSEHSIGDLLQKALKRIGVLFEIHGNVKDVSEAVKAARGFDCLVGIPAEVLYMCRTDGSLRPKSVLLSADYVPESVIKAIEDTWHSKVYTHYGMTETGYGGGIQCESGLGYHMRDADLLFEIIDPKSGRQLPPGQYGEVVLTSLQNEAMPFIRYRMGDIARMLTEPCPCGGILPRLDKVMGRSANMLSLSNGSVISIHRLDEVMFAISGVRNYSAKLINGKTLNLVVDSESELDALSLEKTLAYDIELQIVYNKLPSCMGRGKRRIELL